MTWQNEFAKRGVQNRHHTVHFLHWCPYILLPPWRMIVQDRALTNNYSFRKKKLTITQLVHSLCDIISVNGFHIHT
jgi:hypothetical protein